MEQFVILIRSISFFPERLLRLPDVSVTLSIGEGEGKEEKQRRMGLEKEDLGTFGGQKLARAIGQAETGANDVLGRETG